MVISSYFFRISENSVWDLYQHLILSLLLNIISELSNEFMSSFSLKSIQSKQLPSPTFVYPFAHPFSPNSILQVQHIEKQQNCSSYDLSLKWLEHKAIKMADIQGFKEQLLRRWESGMAGTSEGGEQGVARERVGVKGKIFRLGLVKGNKSQGIIC